ncbi:hypothetical protein [Psychrobacillus sp. FSL K6-1464]|uniref:hypothetical protein n=1 Tax=Psychrobacillus sp. FSL K6-1464 TaxID=2921545 RepID=UPI0030FC8AC0
MKKTFEVMHDGHHIKLVNSWFTGEKLYVNGQLQDENLGLAVRAVLNGELKSNDDRKSIKVALGGFFKINCRIFVENNLIYPNKKK